MKIGINQFCFPGSYDVGQALHSAKAFGYESFEVCLTAAEAAPAGQGVTDALDISRYHNRLLNLHSTEGDLAELKKLAEGADIPIGSVGGIVSFSVYPLTALDPRVAQKSVDAVKKMLDSALYLGASTVLVIPGMLTEKMDYEAAYHRVRNRLATLCDYAPGVTIALENVWNHFLHSPLELARLVDEVGRENLGVYFDVGNARRFGYPQQWLRTLGKRVKMLHLKDYRVAVDNISGFTNLLDGDVNFPQIAEALDAIGFDGTANVELIPPAHYALEASLTYARTTAQRLLASKNKTEELR